MVTFLSFFLSLVTGPQTVELDAAPTVVRIELRLDGKKVATLNHPPWTTVVDFGERLEPHHLEALAYGNDGQPMGSTEQWVNLPKPRSDLKLIVGDSEQYPTWARLVWDSIVALNPRSSSISLNGKPLEIDPSGRAVLPELDRNQIHLLRAEIDVGTQVVRTEKVLGGSIEETLSSALTAIPVVWSKSYLPKPKDLMRAFSSQGQHLRVIAVEKGPSDLLVVQDQSTPAQNALRVLSTKIENSALWPEGRITGSRSLDRIQVLFPQPIQAETRASSEIFPMTENLSTDPALTSRRWILMALPAALTPPSAAEHRFSDAVAVAGIQAAAGQRARAVILIQGKSTEDRSQHSAANIERFLSDLAVPLRVWSTEKPGRSELTWSNPQSIRNANDLKKRIRELRRFLDSQLMIWVEGHHSIHEIKLTELAPSSLSLAGQPQSQKPRD